MGVCCRPRNRRRLTGAESHKLARHELRLTDRRRKGVSVSDRLSQSFRVGVRWVSWVSGTLCRRSGGLGQDQERSELRPHQGWDERKLPFLLGLQSIGGSPGKTGAILTSIHRAFVKTHQTAHLKWFVYFIYPNFQKVDLKKQRLQGKRKWMSHLQLAPPGETKGISTLALGFFLDGIMVFSYINSCSFYFQVLVMCRNTQLSVLTTFCHGGDRDLSSLCFVSFDSWGFLAALWGLWEPTSSTKDWTHASCSGRAESQPLHFQGSPWSLWS